MWIVPPKAVTKGMQKEPQIQVMESTKMRGSIKEGINMAKTRGMGNDETLKNTTG
jgi:hypothetical protein